MHDRRAIIRAVQSLCGAVVLVAGAAAAPAAALAPAKALALVIPCNNQSALDNAINAGGTYSLSPGCTYTLTSQLHHVANGKTVTLQGNGATITRSGMASPFSILTVDSGGTLNLSTVTISNGDAGGGYGGGIHNDGVLTVTSSVIRDNHANYSGGIGGGTDSTTTIRLSAITGNTADKNGGGVANDGRMTITQSTFTGNTAGQQGGGAANTNRLDVTSSTFRQNTASQGGGIANFVDKSGVPVTRLVLSVVTANQASPGPGGVYNNGGTVTLSLSAVVGNSIGNCSGSTPPIPGCSF